MQKFLFSVYDSKARVFSNPFTSINQDVAKRDFTRAANDPSSDICRFPTDYTLVELGEFEDDTGAMNIHQNPIQIGIAANFKE